MAATVSVGLPELTVFSAASPSIVPASELHAITDSAEQPRTLDCPYWLPQQYAEGLSDKQLQLYMHEHRRFEEQTEALRNALEVGAEALPVFKAPCLAWSVDFRKLCHDRSNNDSLERIRS